MKKIFSLMGCLGFIFFANPAEASTLNGIIDTSIGVTNTPALTDVPDVTSEATTIGKIKVISLLAIRFILYAVGIGAVAMITYAGLRFVGSVGSEEQVKTAKDTFINVVIGLIAVFLGLLVVQNIIRILS